MKIENPKVKIGKVLDEVRNIWANILTPDEKMKLEEKAEFILSQMAQANQGYSMN